MYFSIPQKQEVFPGSSRQRALSQWKLHLKMFVLLKFSRKHVGDTNCASGKWVLACRHTGANVTAVSRRIINVILQHIFLVFFAFTCVFAAVHLQMRQLEVTLVASWVGAHERALLAGL